VASKSLTLREGIAPVRDRLVATLFLAALLHAIVILGITFTSVGDEGAGAPGLEVILSTEELPESDANDSATYLAQRTQVGSGNTTKRVAPRNRASSIPVPGQAGSPDGTAIGPTGNAAGDREEQLLSTTSWQANVHYLADSGDIGTSNEKAALLAEQKSDQPGPEDETGPEQLRGPKRDELWITPDTRAATLAPYLDAWRRKVERVGTVNYPAVARAKAGSSSPVLEVAVNSNGVLEKAVIRTSSGDPSLDAAAIEILKLASPFDPFPPELSREYRLLRFAYEWQFTGGRVERGGVTAVP
jgi:periplasmic protein TonB